MQKLSQLKKKMAASLKAAVLKVAVLKDARIVKWWDGGSAAIKPRKNCHKE